MKKGRLRVYLGYAAGVGKTYAMLNEGCRRKQRGADVVVGFVETHKRLLTQEQIRDLEVLPRRTIEYRGSDFTEMDIDAVLARKPEIALVDELAHTNVTGSRNKKRWQDVEELLVAGVTVITSLNIQHLDSLNDVVERITGVAQQETIPDEIVRSADQIELVDMSPWALRRRMAHGNIYPPEKIDAALSNYFREGNLTALRELALLWLADRVEESLQDYLRAHDITEAWETRERVLVAVSGRSEGDRLIRRAGRIASRRGADLVAVHVLSEVGDVDESDKELDEQQELVRAMSGSFHEIVGSDVATSLLEVARAEGATQIVMGASSRSRWSELLRGSVINQVIRGSGPIDVHVISSSEEAHEPLKTERVATLPPRRRNAGFGLALITLPLLTVILSSVREDLALSTVMLLYLSTVVAVAAVGGRWPALTSGLVSSLLINWYFTPPLYALTIRSGEDLLSLLVFLLVGAVVAGLVDTSARQRAQAERGRAEAAALARLAGSLLREADPVPRLLAELRTTFGLDSAAVMRQMEEGWSVEESAGDSVPTSPEGATMALELEDSLFLVLSGRRMTTDDRRIITAFAAQLKVGFARRRLLKQATRATELEETSDLRAAILAAVSHDLRTPLASIKASVTSLRQQDVEWSAEEAGDFLATIEEETDRLTTLVGNLLDMSRLQVGAVKALLRPIGLEEIVPRALDSVRDKGAAVRLDVSESLPRVRADAALLERAIANLVDNALAWSDPDRTVLVTASVLGDRVTLHIVDRGPGIPEEERNRVFEPFLRLGNRSNRAGSGLGLAVAKGFVEASDGLISLEDTPGGGLTVSLSLKAVR